MDIRSIKSDVEDKFVNVNDVIIHLMKLSSKVSSKEASDVLKALIDQLTDIRDSTR